MLTVLFVVLAIASLYGAVYFMGNFKFPDWVCVSSSLLLVAATVLFLMLGMASYMGEV